MQKTSDEQNIIIEHIKKGNNVVVDACAGSGKSTTILSAAIEMPEKRFLQITYNAMLRREIKDKIKELELKNITVHTYHSLAVANYLLSAHTDTGIREIIQRKLAPSTILKKYDVLVIDETQDMTYLYFQLVVKFAMDMGTQFQLMILGDYMQGLYEFKGADIRFLTHADDIWRDHSLLKTREFAKCTLKMSYRITNQMALYVNRAMLGEDRLQACRNGEPVVYIRNSRSNIQKVVVAQIRKLLEEGAKPSDIFVLGASVKGANNQIRRIENVLVESGIPCHVPMFETDKIDEKVIHGKVVFSTFHCVKGRQRPYVFVVGFDNTYLTFYARNLAKMECPNTLYVACTRATKGMYLLESDQYATDKPLEFLKMTHHDMKAADFVEFKGTPQSIFYDKEETAEDKTRIITHHVTPTDLIKFIPESVLEEITPLLNTIFIKESGELDEIEIPTMTKTRRGFYEDVSDLNGIAIPSMYYDYIQSQWETEGEGEREDKSSQNILYDIIQGVMSNTKENEHGFLRKITEKLSPECETVSDYLFMANVYVAAQEKLYFKLKQIDRDEYNWLSEGVLAKCKSRLMEVLGAECDVEKPQIEKTIIHYMEEEEHARLDESLAMYFDETEKFRFAARIDLATEQTVWELKCTTAIHQDHLIQVVIYAWIWRTMDPNLSKEFRIFNIKTGEILRLDASMDILTQIMVALLKGKYGEHVMPSDVDFMANCRTTITKTTT